MLKKINPSRNEELEPLENPGQVTGFSSPAGDYVQDRLHVIQRLVKDPTNTFYFEMENNEMMQVGIIRGALLVVDRSVKPRNGSIIVGYFEGEWLTRMLVSNQYLSTGPMDRKPIKITEDGILIFGVVTWACNPLIGEGMEGIVKLD